MTNKELITKFYDSFAKGDIERMIDCYHDDIVFQDPAFGTLKGEMAKNMWRMLLSRREATTNITYSNVQETSEGGTSQWVASYIYGPKKRKIVNLVSAQMVISEGKITIHTDTFDMWKWTSQALGTTGYLLGWSSFFKGKIQQKLNRLLNKHVQKQK
jgi:ketosteroid isomerase-like protein